MSPWQQVLSEELQQWPVAAAAAAVLDERGAVVHGSRAAQPWASVTKLLTALVVLHAADHGELSLDEQAGPPGSTLRHLLAHASGLSRETQRVQAPPATRRIYSNSGYEVVAAHVEGRLRTPFADLVHDRLLAPLEMHGTRFAGSAAHGAVGPVQDLARLAGELLEPRLLPARLVGQATAPAFGRLAGVLPGFGHQDPNDWGLGPELRGTKTPHWTSPHNAPSTFGHFGQSGSFLWVDPVARVACVGLSGTPFGPWAADRWPVLASRVLAVSGDPDREARDRTG